MSKIVELYNDITSTINANPKLEQQITTDLLAIVANAYKQSMSSDEGFCFKFNLPITPVMKMFNTLNLDPKVVDNNFMIDWKLPPTEAVMHHDSYYQILLLLIYYGIKNNKPYIYENSLLILLFKIWNGRKHTYLQYCDKKIMKYVTTHMCTNRHMFGKYRDPLAMLKDYFVPTMLKKYKDEILNDSIKLKRLFEQTYARIRQLFVQNMRDDIQTGKKLAQGGILPMYMQAKAEGKSISSASVGGLNDEEGPSFDEYSTISNREEITNSTSDFITMNPNPNYTPTFISQLNSQTHVSSKAIEKILISLHNHKYHDLIHDAISIILSKTNIQEKNDICRPEFTTNIKKGVISSKNNSDSQKLQKLINIFLQKIFVEDLNADFNKISNVNQIQLRNVVINGIVYNLQRNICKNQN